MQETYDELDVKTKWRVREVKNGKAYMLAYNDARDVQKVLDHVCGIGNWQTGEKMLGDKLYREIMINVEGEGWVTKSDVGTESKFEKVKGESSDAFKRAAVMWGIFRNNYERGEMVLNAKNGKPVTAQGKELYTAEQQSAYCNGLNTEIGSLMRVYKENQAAFESHPEALKCLSDLKEFLNGLNQ